MSAHGSIKNINKFPMITIYKYFFWCIPLIFFFILLLLILLVSPGIKIIAVKAYLANGNRVLSNKEPSPCFKVDLFSFLASDRGSRAISTNVSLRDRWIDSYTKETTSNNSFNNICVKTRLIFSSEILTPIVKARKSPIISVSERMLNVI